MCGMGLPMVSIVINNYNYGRFLRDAIESALGQTYPLTEVIVVDDGSLDNSREVIEEYVARGKVRAVYKENGGQASAFNAGFEASRGDLIIFLDADDVLLPNAVEEVVKAWRPGIVKVQWRLGLVDGSLKPLGGQTYPERGIPMPSGWVYPKLLRWRFYPSPPTSGNAFARSFLQTILPMPLVPWRISADFYLLTAAGLSGPILSVDRVLGYYRIHGENSWARMDITESSLKREILIQQAQREYILRKASSQKWSIRYPFGHAHLFKIELLAKALNSELIERGYVDLALRGLFAAMSFPYLTFGKRIRQSLFFVIALILPQHLRRQWLLWGLDTSRRPAWLKKVMGLF